MANEPARVQASTEEIPPVPSVPLMCDVNGGVYLAAVHADRLERVETMLAEFMLAMKAGALGQWTK